MTVTILPSAADSSGTYRDVSCDTQLKETKDNTTSVLRMAVPVAKENLMSI